MNKQIWPFSTTGIPDDWFTRGDVPMTKKEVRVVSLAQARITPEMTILDVGAGTGSFSIEAAIQAAKGKVFAIEKGAEGVELIKANADKFGLSNIEVLHGSAPEALEGIPRPDVVFIGGSGGHLPSILEKLDYLLAPSGRLVANVVLLENLVVITDFLKTKSYSDLEINLVSITKAVPVAGKLMMKGTNPVYVISAQKP